MSARRVSSSLTVLNGWYGHAFPMRVRGSLLGVLVVDPRPGEHYAADGRELMAHVAHEVGAAQFALRAQASEVQAQASEARQKQAQVQASEALLNEVRTGTGKRGTRPRQ